MRSGATRRSFWARLAATLFVLFAGCVLIPVASLVIGHRPTAFGPFVLVLGLIASLVGWGAIAMLVALVAAIRQRTLMPSLPSRPPGMALLLVGSPLAAAVAALVDAALGSERLLVTIAAYVAAGLAHGGLAYVLARAGYLDPIWLGEDDAAAPR